MGLEKYFSQRHEYKEVNLDIQFESMNYDLKTAIWNSLFSTFLYGYNINEWIGDDEELGMCLLSVWSLYFKNPLDEYPRRWENWKNIINEYIFGCEWHEVYEIIEFIFDHWTNEYKLENKYIPIINQALKRENSGYRIINRRVTPITDDLEIASIKQALNVKPTLNPVYVQLDDAIKKLSDREKPDFRGSIKDSISAVETMCRILSGNKKITLGKALDILEKKSNVKIHSALKSGFSNLYGWTSDDQGIRHALMEESNLTLNDAKFMLVSCSAFINYLVIKAGASGLDF